MKIRIKEQVSNLKSNKCVSSSNLKSNENQNQRNECFLLGSQDPAWQVSSSPQLVPQATQFDSSLPVLTQKPSTATDQCHNLRETENKQNRERSVCKKRKKIQKDRFYQERIRHGRNRIIVKSACCETETATNTDKFEDRKRERERKQ